MKYSVSSYSFNQYVSAGKMTQADCIEKAKELGFDGIEFTDITGDTFEERKANATAYKKKADELGIVISSYAVGANLYHDTPEANAEAVAKLKEHVDIAAILGAKIMRHDVCYTLGKSGNSRSFDLMLPTIAANTRKVTEYAESKGVVTCTENHGFIAQDSDRVERLFNAVAHNNYGLLVDVGNFVCAGEDPAMAVCRVAPYAVHVHAKDMILKDEPTEGFFMTRDARYCCGAVFGEGVVPVKRCFAILKNAGYDGWVALEYEGKEDCISGITRGYSNLKKLVESL